MFEIPFNSVRRWQLVVTKCLCANQSSSTSHTSSTLSVNNSNSNLLKEQQKLFVDDQSADYIVMMKGAAEVILSRCNKVTIEDEIVDITDEFRAECQVHYIL